MQFAEIVFLVAGIYGVVVLTPLYLLVELVLARTKPTGWPSLQGKKPAPLSA